MDKVLQLTLQVLSMRMSNEEKAKIPEELRWDDDVGEGGRTKLSWLYVNDVKSDVENLVDSLSTSR